MHTEINGVILIFISSIILAWPLGHYLAKVFKGVPVWTDFLAPLEKKLFQWAGIDPAQSLDWRGNTFALLKLNGAFFLVALILLLLQGLIPLWNPQHLGDWEPTLALHTAVSFMTNTNLQHYSGETTASYFTQLLVFCWLQFVSAATGIAACALLFKGLAQRQSSDLGNFNVLFVKSCTRILLPLAIPFAILLMGNGIPATLEGYQTVQTLEGVSQKIATGPVAPLVAIKQLGTNGGGFFGTNSAHPFENANYLTNAAENLAILLLPMALVFALGFYLKRVRLSVLLFGVMTVLFLSLTATVIYFETKGNTGFQTMGLDSGPNWEGKEMRFGPVASAFWGTSTTATSNGSVNAMFDSFTPLAGGILLLDMFINAVYGGVGVGLINFFVYLIVAVFIAGLMIGRTPEILGKKIEAREIKIAVLVVILHPLLILAGAGLAAHLVAIQPGLAAAWLHNPGYHGYSEMLYEFTSASANNGSGFEGLGDNTPFWNLLTGLVMLLGRFLPIIGPLAIAGSLASKKAVPQTAGSLQMESPAFAAVLLAVILVVAALSFFPALALGPLAEFLS